MARILLLEPDRLLAASIKRYFAAADHDVAIHSDPQEAVTSADSLVPSLVITELQLAGRSGVEFLYEFRSYPEWQNVPVIIFTGLHDGQLAAYSAVFKELNIAACMYKPATSLAQLLDKTQQTLQPAKV